MIQLLLIIFLIIFVGVLVALMKNRKKDSYDWDDDWYEESYVLFGGLSLAIFIVIFAVLIGLTIKVQDLDLIEEKIALKENRNAEIEDKVVLLVDKYMNYESTTFKELKPSEIMVAVELYPELKSDAMIQEEIKLYRDNIAEITSLKEQKINGKIMRWWLYFGGE